MIQEEKSIDFYVVDKDNHLADLRKENIGDVLLKCSFQCFSLPGVKTYVLLTHIQAMNANTKVKI